MTAGRPWISILNYRMGNLHSVRKALELKGANATIAERPAEAEGADAVVLPGVGAFGDAVRQLRDLGFDRAVLSAVDKGVPLLGICVGLQVLFDTSEEMGQHRGLGLFPGTVVRFSSDLVVPHVGWNQLQIRRPHPIVEGVPSGAYAYFTHSYYAVPSDADLVVATTDYGIDFASICSRDNVCGVQFHPEKSWQVGLGILGAFVRSLG